MTVTTAPADCPPAPEPEPPAGQPWSRRRRMLVGALSLLIVAGVFGFAFPRVASYSGVWASLAAMSWPGIALIGAAFAASQLVTWMMITAVIPQLPLRDAAVMNLGSTAVANTLPGGGAVAMGVSWAMLSSWGVGTGEFVRYTLVSGLWNVFARLGLPVVALVLLVIAGGASPALQVAAYSGAAVLVVIAVSFRAVLRSERAAALVGLAVSRVLARCCALVRRKPPQQVPGILLEFRAGASGLLAERGLRITVTTAASQISLWLVLLACLRFGGVSQAQVSWEESLAAFAFVRLLSVLPLTPGGIGVVELGLTGPLVVGMNAADAARVAAAVLLFRAVTYLLPIPLGAAAYLWWRHSRPARSPGGPPGAPRGRPPAPADAGTAPSGTIDPQIGPAVPGSARHQPAF